MTWWILSLSVLAGAPSAGDGGASAEERGACLTCHENLAGRLSGVIEEWKRSVHFANKVTCHGCHGGDPSVRREQFDTDEEFKRRSHLRRDGRIFGLGRDGESFTATVRGRALSYFCGSCHDTIKEKHLGSPHGGLGEPSCLYCHGQGSHAIGHADSSIIDTRSIAEGGRCAMCHREATMETVGTIKEIITDAETDLATAVEQYEWLREHDYKNLALDRMYEHSKDTRSQLRQTFHSFNMREITNFASAIESNAGLTAQTYEMIAKLEEARKRQALTGLFAVFFLLSFAGVLLYYRHAVLEAATNHGRSE